MSNSSWTLDCMTSEQEDRKGETSRVTQFASEIPYSSHEYELTLPFSLLHNNLVFLVDWVWDNDNDTTTAIYSETFSYSCKSDRQEKRYERTTSICPLGRNSLVCSRVCYSNFAFVLMYMRYMCPFFSSVLWPLRWHIGMLTPSTHGWKRIDEEESWRGRHREEQETHSSSSQSSFSQSALSQLSRYGSFQMSLSPQFGNRDKTKPKSTK